MSIFPTDNRVKIDCFSSLRVTLLRNTFQDEVYANPVKLTGLSVVPTFRIYQKYQLPANMADDINKPQYKDKSCIIFLIL